MKTEGMNYSEAMQALDLGANVKLPEWVGHWFKNTDGQISVFTRTGDILDSPNHAHYIMREDWAITYGLKGFEFAILALKANKKVAREGWNGKGMYAFMRPADNLRVDFIPNVKSLPQSVKDDLAASSSDFIDFKAYFCLKSVDGSIINGWVPSQTDLIAEDWSVVS
jgi:hypothetical protein